jgi:hypothetical protein
MGKILTSKNRPEAVHYPVANLPTASNRYDRHHRMTFR